MRTAKYTYASRAFVPIVFRYFSNRIRVHKFMRRTWVLTRIYMRSLRNLCTNLTETESRATESLLRGRDYRGLINGLLMTMLRSLRQNSIFAKIEIFPEMTSNNSLNYLNVFKSSRRFRPSCFWKLSGLRSVVQKKNCGLVMCSGNSCSVFWRSWMARNIFV